MSRGFDTRFDTRSWVRLGGLFREDSGDFEGTGGEGEFKALPF